MENAEALKEAVREKYGQLARAGEGSCCGPTNCCGTGSGDGFVDFSEDYSKLEGYEPGADMGLGCGIPLDAADLRPGQSVLDLGSGAGNDVFVGISDVVLEGDFPEALRSAAELYVGCVSGALPKQEYLEALRSAGFKDVAVVREKTITLPEDLLAAYLDPDQRRAYAESGLRILSVTIQGTSPLPESGKGVSPCCIPLGESGKSGSAGPCCLPLG